MSAPEPAKRRRLLYVTLPGCWGALIAGCLAVKDLERAGGFQRKNLLVVTTTGSGWVDPALSDTFEYLSGGDSAFRRCSNLRPPETTVMACSAVSRSLALFRVGCCPRAEQNGRGKHCGVPLQLVSQPLPKRLHAYLLVSTRKSYDGVVGVRGPADCDTLARGA